MLMEIERAEIEAEIPKYPVKSAVCIDALRILQRHRGWVSDESIQDLAQFLAMSPAEIDSVATFYNLIFRRETGRHVILLCESVSCWIMGSEVLRETLRRRLGVQPGETTGDKRFTLLPTVCLGACDHAPLLMIDQDTHRDMTPEKLAAALEDYR